MASTARNRNILIGTTLGVAVAAILVILLLRGCGEQTVESTVASTVTSTTSTAGTTSTKTTTPATAPAETAPTVTQPAQPAPATTSAPPPSPQSDFSTACADSIDVTPPHAVDPGAPITVTVNVGGTTPASAVTLRYSRRVNGEPGEPSGEKELAPAGQNGVWKVTFNAPEVAGAYDFYAWATDQQGRTNCGGPVGMIVTVGPPAP
jgi:hypothetical protein